VDHIACFNLGVDRMKTRKSVLLASLLAASVAAVPAAFAQAKYVGWSTGYLPNYANYPITKINWKIYTHLAWFSINGDGNGNLSGLGATQAKAFTSLAHQNNTKALICVGGGGAGGQFQSATSNNALPKFIANLVKFMQDNQFDGIDIDWEDGIIQSQYAALFKGLAAEFDKITPRPILTVATFMGLANNTAPVAQYIDQVNLMSYYATMTGGDVPIPQQMKASPKRACPRPSWASVTATIRTERWMGPTRWATARTAIPRTSRPSASIPSIRASAASWCGRSTARRVRATA
jgi:hypothetical protein